MYHNFRIVCVFMVDVNHENETKGFCNEINYMTTNNYGHITCGFTSYYTGGPLLSRKTFNDKDFN